MVNFKVEFCGFCERDFRYSELRKVRKEDLVARAQHFGVHMDCETKKLVIVETLIFVGIWLVLGFV